MSKKVEKKDEKAPAVAKTAAPAKTEAPKSQKALAAAPKSDKGPKKEEKGVHYIYKIEGEKVVRLRPTCERCGPGYFMADHQDRFTCGHCGFTRYKRA